VVAHGADSPSGDATVAAICAFSADAAVEYFVAKIPDCCVHAGQEEARLHKPSRCAVLQHLSIGNYYLLINDRNSNVDPLTLAIGSRAMAGAISHWSSKWVYAEEVNILCQDYWLTKSANDRGSNTFKLITEYSER